MSDHTKREKTRRYALDPMAMPRPLETSQFLCNCGAPAQYEVNRGRKGVAFVCKKHVPADF